MPRGKSYVNNNQGVAMQSSKKKKAPSMEQCFYGKGCTRKDCFYSHDNPGPGAAGGDKSTTEPCMPFLAGQCTFSAGGCRKRHPGKAEAAKLVAKYKQTKCRFGKDCKTAGCLYIHPDDKDAIGGTAAFPPLAGSNGAPRAAAPSGAWKPMQPTGAAIVSAAGPPRVANHQRPQQTAPAAAVPAPVKSAWQPSPPQQQAQPAPVWGQGRNPVLANHSSPPPPPAAVIAMNGTMANGVAGAAAQVTPNRHQAAPTVAMMTIQPKNPAAVMSFAAAASPTQAHRTSDSSLNINAREFVPGGF